MEIQETDFDIIIIGSGPGGYVAAERAGKAGKRVLLIEKDSLGGVCLNWGCIPTKSLLHSAKNYRHVLDGGQFGVLADNVRFDLAAAMQWKAQTIEQLRNGIAHLMKKHRVEVRQGEARLISPRSVQVADTLYRGNQIIIATGSSPAIPPIPGADQALNSRDILSLDKLPERVAIIGGGVIGLEFASFFSLLGKEVHVFEILDEIVPMMDREMAAFLRASMPEISFHLETRVEAIEGRTLRYSPTPESADFDLILLAAGRQPNIRGIGLEELRIDTNRQGIVVNEQMQTNISNIYALGDVTGRSLLAHSASRMAEVAVNNILGERDRMRYDAIPWAVYTQPEAAGCGLSEQEARSQGYEVKVARYNYRANGRALAEGTEGRARVIVDAASQKILGLHLVGPYATENIFAAAIIMENELRTEELKEVIFPHPTVSESMREALISL